MVIIGPVDDPATSQPLAAANASAGASQPPASNPESSLFDDLGGSDLGGTAAYDAAGTNTAWSSHPPYAPAATTSGWSNPSSSPMISGSMVDTFFLPPAMEEQSYWYPQTQLGFPPRFSPAVPFAAQCAMPPPPPPVLLPMPATRVEPSYSNHPQTQGSPVSAAAGGGGEAFIVHAVPDAQKAAKEATALTPRRRGRPRKEAAAPAKPKPAFKPPNKRATARGKRAASRPTASVAGSSATMAGQVQVQQPDQQAANVASVQVQQPDQAASSVGALADSNQPAPCTNPMALLYQDDIQEQWQLMQPTCSNSLSAGDQAAAAAVWQQQEVMVPYGPYADTSVAGVRFQPTDQELIFYLRLKHAGREMPVEFFKEFDVYQETPATSRAVCGEVDGFWYAFSPRFRKYKNGERPARSVLEAPGGMQVGYWKSNTKVIPVRARGSRDGALIGNVTSLTFHLGRQPKGTQTPWKMKEYAIPENQHAPDGSAMRLNDWVVCKLFYKERVIKIGAEEEHQSGEASSDENDGRAGDEATSMVPDVQSLAGNSEQDLCVEDYLGYGEIFAHL